MYSLYESFLEDKEKDNKLTPVNKVQNTTQQPQTTTLYGSIANNNESNSSGSTNGWQQGANSLAQNGLGALSKWGASNGSGAGGAGWAMGADMGKNLYNSLSGKTDKDYSDTEESIIYPLEGAAKGYSYGGPWGALGGAVYGLGYSLKDDLGLKDSNFFTKMLFPIDMGGDYNDWFKI